MVWLSAVIVCMGCLILLRSFMGYLGTRYSNRLLLNMCVALGLGLELGLLRLRLVGGQARGSV